MNCLLRFRPFLLPIAFLIVGIQLACSQTEPQPERWQLGKSNSIQWNVRKAPSYPYQDHMGLSGQSVDLILEWKVDSNGHFSAERLIRWPMLRTLPDDTHASLQRRLNEPQAARPLIEGEPLSSGRATQLAIAGHLKIFSRHLPDLQLTRTIFPSVLSPAVIDYCEIKNTSLQPMTIQIPAWRREETTEPEQGLWGSYIIEEFITGAGHYRVAPGETVNYAVIRTARKVSDAPYYGNPAAELAARQQMVESLQEQLTLETPDSVLNQLFAFSKIRATESIFSTRGGLMHGPGGYNKYLAAIWANDQAEYINPFFPFLGDPIGNESAMNSFRHFAHYINDDFDPIPSSIISEGRSFWNGAGDRGDMAMIAYGAARFAMASGNPDWAEELWPLIEWCLAYCNRQLTPEGVVASNTDELEGRFPAGEANLCTSALYFDALLSAAYLAHDLGLNSSVSPTMKYLKQAERLNNAIKAYFEAEVEGYATYQYYDGNTILRSWICIPLTVGIMDRADGTVDALFSDRLWTADGLLTKAGTTTVWDRSTLYALRGILATDRFEEGLVKLQAFSRERLLGDHVPYVIEAYPEQNQSHLSAESGLYCRIFTEGLFGIRPTGLYSFSCTPRLPQDWDQMTLRNVNAFGQQWNMEISRYGDLVRLLITDMNNDVLYNAVDRPNTSHKVEFPN